MKQQTGNRTRVHTIRFTEEEEAQLLSDMKSHDYLSISKYIRTLVLGHRIEVKKVKITDRSIRNQINDLSKKISSIGTNYNQVVKRYNSLAGSKRKNGDPVINTKATAFYITKLIDLTKEVLTRQEQIIEAVNQIHLEKD